MPLLSVFLTSCMTVNPYNNYSQVQLSKVGIYDLCRSVDEHEKSNTVSREIHRRGFKDCSESELYCQENLGLKPKTPAYINCRMQRDQHNLLAAGMMLGYLQSTQPKK